MKGQLAACRYDHPFVCIGTIDGTIEDDQGRTTFVTMKEYPGQKFEYEKCILMKERDGWREMCKHWGEDWWRN